MNIRYILIISLTVTFFSTSAQDLTSTSVEVNENIDNKLRTVNDTARKWIEFEEKNIIPFAEVDQPPLATDCKSKWKIEKQRKCTADYVRRHIRRYFNIDLATQLGIQGIVEINISFIIDKNGEVININATGGPEKLNIHAIEVVSKLEKFEPAKKDGKTINVSYKMPLAFSAHN